MEQLEEKRPDVLRVLAVHLERGKNSHQFISIGLMQKCDVLLLTKPVASAFMKKQNARCGASSLAVGSRTEHTVRPANAAAIAPVVVLPHGDVEYIPACIENERSRTTMSATTATAEKRYYPLPPQKGTATSLDRFAQSSCFLGLSNYCFRRVIYDENESSAVYIHAMSRILVSGTPKPRPEFFDCEINLSTTVLSPDLYIGASDVRHVPGLHVIVTVKPTFVEQLVDDGLLTVFDFANRSAASFSEMANKQNALFIEEANLRVSCLCSKVAALTCLFAWLESAALFSNTTFSEVCMEQIYFTWALYILGLKTENIPRPLFEVLRHVVHVWRSNSLTHAYTINSQPPQEQRRFISVSLPDAVPLYQSQKPSVVPSSDSGSKSATTSGTGTGTARQKPTFFLPNRKAEPFSSSSLSSSPSSFSASSEGASVSSSATRARFSTGRKPTTDTRRRQDFYSVKAALACVDEGKRGSRTEVMAWSNLPASLSPALCAMKPRFVMNLASGEVDFPPWSELHDLACGLDASVKTFLGHLSSATNKRNNMEDIHTISDNLERVMKNDVITTLTAIRYRPASLPDPSPQDLGFRPCPLSGIMLCRLPKIAMLSCGHCMDSMSYSNWASDIRKTLQLDEAPCPECGKVVSVEAIANTHLVPEMRIKDKTLYTGFDEERIRYLEAKGSVMCCLHARITEILNDDESNRLVLYVSGEKKMRQVEAALKDGGILTLCLMGGKDGIRDNKMILKMRDERSKVRVLLLDVNNSHSGLDLYFFTHLVYLQPNNNPIPIEKEIQAMNRLFRASQKKPVKIVTFVQQDSEFDKTILPVRYPSIYDIHSPELASRLQNDKNPRHRAATDTELVYLLQSNTEYTNNPLVGKVYAVPL